MKRIKDQKIKHILVSLLILLFVIPGRIAYGQAGDGDSSAFFSAEWKVRKLHKNIILKEASFSGNLFNSNQYISIIEVKKGAKSAQIRFAAKEDLTPTSQLAEENGALAAVNGNFFKFQKPHNAVDYLRINGEEICGNANENRGKRAFNQLGVIAADSKRIAILKPGEDFEWEKKLKEPEVMTAGPLLIYGGASEQLEESPFYKNRHPRTAIAILENGTMLLITVDGRNALAQGMTLYELQKMGKWLNAVELLNLDGGGSTTMYVRGVGVVNHPSDNKKFDNEGERRVANALLLMVKE